MITVEPYGGLANRMRAFASCYWLAKKLQKPIHLIWEKSFELNCSFQKLFELPKDVSYEEISFSRSKLFVKKRIHSGLRSLGINLPRGYDIYLFDNNIVNLKSQKFDFEEIRKHNKVFINTVEYFYKTENPFVFLNPVEKLQKTIDSYANKFSENTVGVHIRRTDNMNSTRYSPLSGFLEHMVKIVEETPDTKFFLATDSSQVTDELNIKFKNRIITYPKVLDRDSEEGIEGALVDIYCLSKCKKIIGSYYSSFSEVAAQISNVELYQVYKC